MIESILSKAFLADSSIDFLRRKNSRQVQSPLEPGRYLMLLEGVIELLPTQLDWLNWQEEEPYFLGQDKPSFPFMLIL